MGKGVKEKIAAARLRKQQTEYRDSVTFIGGAKNVSYEDYINGRTVIRNKTIFEEQKKVVRKKKRKKKGK